MSYRLRERGVVVTVFLVILALVAGACVPAAPGPAAPAGGKTKLVIYTAKENEEIAEYLPVAEKALPDLGLEVLRLSTGDLTARLLAEKDNPQADVIWGVAATSMMIFEREGMLEPYAPKGVENILPAFKSPQDPATWVGVDAYLTAFCFNTEKAKEFDLPMPTSWADLTDPVYKGHIVMPNPASSGTGFMFVSSVLQGLEDQAWDYLGELDKNMAIYTKSGSKPCKLAAAGEYPIGISFAFVAARLKADGAPLEMVLPEEGSGYEVEANGLVKGTDNPEAAKRFLDWAISEEAMAMYAKYFAVVAQPGFPVPEGMPEDTPDRLFPMNFQWSSDNRDNILEEWTGRFAAKTEGE
ncbi:MAG: putative 2-aminoethylphosphonate ABC transporter substrate-binding protein [Anaerolineae bacterium]